MLTTQTIACCLPCDFAQTLNRESGRIYTDVMVRHWRAFRKSGHWVSSYAAQKWGNWRDRDTARLLHSHSVDAAQDAFYKACKTAKACKGEGARYPHKRKFYRTTMWKNTGIRKRGDALLLALARGMEPITVALPERLRALEVKAFKEVRLVYDLASSGYEWHMVIEDGLEPAIARGERVAGIDLGEIYPVAACDGEEGVVFSCRELRSVTQGVNKRLASLNSKLSKLQKGSRRHRALKKRKSKFLAKQAKRARDLEHKVSHEVIAWSKERGVGTLAIGDVRDIADKTKVEKRLNRKTRQKVSHWSHGKMRAYLAYKALAAGIAVHDKVSEAYTSQTCVCCGARTKPRGRVYSCSSCGFRGHRDLVGAANIRSRFTSGELGGGYPATTKYRRAFQKWNVIGVVARHGASGLACGQEATAIHRV